MLHLRIMAPTERTDDLVSLLRRTVGTCHLAVFPGAAKDPGGDVIACDVAREAADELLDDLKKTGIAHDGAVAVDDVEMWLSDRAEKAKVDAPGEGMDAVVWEKLAGETDEESKLSVTYLTFLTVATMIAACGVILDSEILIVGAMVVGPEFGPLAGVCTAAVQRLPRLALTSLIALVVGFAFAMLMTFGFSLLMNATNNFSEDMYRSGSSVAEFIWSPDWRSFIVALLAGVAGMLSLTSSKSGALTGVAISVTTVPAAGNAALALTYREYAEAWGSMQQLGLNMAGILIAGTLTLLAQKAFWAWQRTRRPAPA